MELPQRDSAPPSETTAEAAVGGGYQASPAVQPDREPYRAPESPPETEPARAPEPLAGRPARFARRHALFGGLLLAATVVRVVALLGFPGALLYPDSGGYITVTIAFAPNQLRPDGYPLMLRALEPLHSLAAVIAIQHVMGLGVGVLGYALLRRRGLPGWGATLAMVPVLLSAYAIQIEHFLLSDTLFAFLVMLSLVLMMWWRDPPPLACALAGLLLAAAAVVRSEGIPLLIVFVICLLIRFRGWRTLAGVVLLCAAFALPIAGYATWFHRAHGTYAVTTNEGAFLYATVITFADCAKINPPAPEQRLCLKVPVSERYAYGPYYIWYDMSPIKAIPGGEFGNLANRLGLDFSLAAIRAQPLDYLRVVGQNFEQTFLLHSGHPAAYTIAGAGTTSQQGYMFPAVRPQWRLSWDTAYFYAYDRAGPNVRVVQPYAGWIRAYQRFIVVSGPLLGVIALIGLAGVIASWRRIGGAVLLPWLTGMALLLIPAFIAFDVRYLVCAIPPLCIAAAISCQQIAGGPRGLASASRLPDSGGDAALRQSAG